MKNKFNSRWYKLETMAHNRAMSQPMRPSTIPENVEAKAFEYVAWILERDRSIEAQWSKCQSFVLWDQCKAGMRPRFVQLSQNGNSLAVVEIPHWDFIEHEIVEVNEPEQKVNQLSFL